MFQDLHSSEGIPAVLDGRADIGRHWHPDCLIVVFDGAPTLGEYRGHDGFRQWTRDSLGLLDDPRIRFEDVLYAEGDQVVLRLTVLGHFKTMDMDADFEFFSHYAFRDGLIAYAKGYRDAAEAIAAAQAPSRLNSQ